HRRRHRHPYRLERRLREDGRDRPRQRALDPLRPSLRDRGRGGPERAQRTDRRPHGLDRPLDRTASALRDPGRRRSGRPAALPARRPAPRRRDLAQRFRGWSHFRPRPRPSACVHDGAANGRASAGNRNKQSGHLGGVSSMPHHKRKTHRVPLAFVTLTVTHRNLYTQRQIVGTALLLQGDVMKKYLLGIVGVLALTASGPAGAADMPVKALPMAAPVFNWSRCYIGVHAGWGWGRDRNDFGQAIASGPTENEGFPAEFGPFDHNTSGGVVGAHAGCNWAVDARLAGRHRRRGVLVGDQGQLYRPRGFHSSGRPWNFLALRIPEPLGRRYRTAFRAHSSRRYGS